MKTFISTLFVSVALFALNSVALARTVNVSSGSELQNALQSAMPGDDIVLHPADYGDASFETSGNPVAYFFIDRSGTAEQPITLRSHSRRDLQALYGSGPNGYNNNYVLYVTGSHWIIKDLIIHTGKKGVMMDGANHNIFDNIEVFNIGEEAFHMRKSSSYNVLKNCWIHDSGMITGREGYGEGVYIGSHKGDESGDYSNYNTIAGCAMGWGVTAEPLEIKEATEGTLVERNWFFGGDVSGENFADSFIDVKGNAVTIRNNKFTDEGNGKISRGIHFLNKKTHLESWVYMNMVNMSAGAPFLFIGEGLVHEKWNRKLWDEQSNLVSIYSTGMHDDDISFGGFWGHLRGMGERGSRLFAKFGHLLKDRDADVMIHRPARFYRGYSQLPKRDMLQRLFKKPEPPVIEEPDPSNCLIYTSDDRAELDLSVSTCVDLSIDLTGRTLQVWDSDENPACDFRGTVTSLDGSGSLVVGGNYITSTEMTGQKILFSANNDCQFVKMRIY